MENEILERLQKQDEKLLQIYESVEKTRKYFLWTIIISVVTVLLPLAALIVLIPWLMESISSAFAL